jgi:hypothetical protein
MKTFPLVDEIKVANFFFFGYRISGISCFNLKNQTNKKFFYLV